VSTALRWGLLGTARINRRLIPAMRAARRSAVAAVAGRDQQRVTQYAEEWNIPVAHVGYDTLLKDPTVDAVYIPLPNSLHVEWTLRALDAGKHVLCEKPLALSPEDIDRVGAVAEARERVVAEAFMYRHEMVIARVLELLRDDVVGRVMTIASGFTFDLDRPNDVRLDPALGGGSLWDVGCYAVSAARLVAGCEPLEAFGWASYGPTGIDESFSGLLRFPGQVVASIHSSFKSRYRTWLEVGGQTGVLNVSEPFKPTAPIDLMVTHGGDTRSIRVEAPAMLYVRQVEDFVAAVFDGRKPHVTLTESRGNAAALCALYASARSGRPVTI
jgi:D-xylose 1-dehydrogenase (NADP+, D-xylono-1,5-lactone-forming)